MKKRILVISASLRLVSNSAGLAEAFYKGAAESGHLIKKIDLHNKKINFCTGCLTCQKKGKCHIDDDVALIIDEMKRSDIIALASPVYFYGISGQLKTLLDRTNPLFGQNNRFKAIYLLLAGADTDLAVLKSAENDIQGWIDCFEGVKLHKTIIAGGVTDGGDIAGHPSLDEAFNLGSAV